MVRPMVHSQKHIVQIPVASVAAAAIANVAIATAVLAGAKTTDSEIEVGSTVKACYVEIWLQSDEAGSSSFTCTVEKIQSGTAGMTAASSAALNDYSNKKNVLYTSQGLLPFDGQNPVPIIRQWIKIPKGKQRFGQGDRLALNINALVFNIQFCGVCIYKEYN